VRGLLQRVRRAAVAVGGVEVGAIQQGVLLLLGIAHTDTAASADTLLDRVLRYRLFPDGQGRMNLSLADSGGGLLIVSQFTLMADTRKGLRPVSRPPLRRSRPSGSTIISLRRRGYATRRSPVVCSAPTCRSSSSTMVR